MKSKALLFYVLIDAGADIGQKTYRLPFFKWNYHQEQPFKSYSFTTALELAEVLGCEKIVKFLQEKGMIDKSMKNFQNIFSDKMFWERY